MKMREFYRRRLPHWQIPGAIVFVTFRLYGSLPVKVERRISRERDVIRCMSVRETRDEAELLRRRKHLFAIIDNELARMCLASDNCPRFLGNGEAAGIVIRCIEVGKELRRFVLHRYSVMPNHVHILMEPLPTGLRCSGIPVPGWPPTAWTETGRLHLAGERLLERIEFHSLARIMEAIKSPSSRDIMRLLKTDPPVWQGENFDHWVRDREEYDRIVSYIDNNPIRAGLCMCPEQWPWSSAARACLHAPDTPTHG